MKKHVIIIIVPGNKVRKEAESQIIGLGFSDGVEPVFWGKLWEQIGVSADPPPLGFDFCFRYSSMGNGGLKTD